MSNMKTVAKAPTKLDSREERLVSAMQLLGDKSRFRMFKLLSSDKQLCVSEIADAVDISVPAVSQHFRIFELVGLVDKQRNGQKICYQLRTDDKFVQELIRLI